MIGLRRFLRRVSEALLQVARSEKIALNLQTSLEQHVPNHLVSISNDLHSASAELITRLDEMSAATARLEIALEKNVPNHLVALSNDLHSASAEFISRLDQMPAATARLEIALEKNVPNHLAALSNDLHGATVEIIKRLDALSSGTARRDWELALQVSRIHDEAVRMRQMIARHSASLAWLAEQLDRVAAFTPLTTPLVSVIMPTWNRGQMIERTIQSLLDQSYQNWECIIVDDGSTDNTAQIMTRYLADPRFRFYSRPHRGCSAARNAGLAEVRGDAIAYLDTDNLWLPNYLSAVVSAFERDEELKSVYAAQIVSRPREGFSYIRANPFDFASLSRENFIDINVFAHRRELLERLGGFDESLERLNDWDLILRYTERDKIERLSVVGGIYLEDWRTNRISASHSYEYYRYVITDRRRGPSQTRLKVLYALWHYPQLSESYVRTEIAAVRQMGIEVEVWSEEAVAAAFESEVPVHRGKLSEVIARARPDLVHTHWLDMAEKYSPEVRAAGLPMTVRGHGFEFSPELVMRLDRDPTIQAAYIFPHLADRCVGASAKIKPLSVAFNPTLYQPSKDKDRRMVLRTGCALPTKDYVTFFKTALLCPDHRFVLVLCRAYQLESYFDEVRAMQEQLQAPVELWSDLQHEDVARQMSQAGIYFHTNGPDSSFGMPISICEAMATGSYVIGRRCQATVAYIQDAGAFYETAEEAAALIRQTDGWSEEQWRQAQIRSLDRAYGSFVSTEVLEQVVADWRTLTGNAKSSM